MSEPADAGGPAAASNATPWWAREIKGLIPEARIWIAGVIFLFAWHVLNLLAANVAATKGDLSKDTLFVAIATAIFGGSGFLAVIGFWYVASKKDDPAQGGSQ